MATVLASHIILILASKPPVPVILDISIALVEEIRNVRTDVSAYGGRVDQWQRELQVNYKAAYAEEAMTLLNTMKQRGRFL